MARFEIFTFADSLTRQSSYSRCGTHVYYIFRVRPFPNSNSFRRRTCRSQQQQQKQPKNITILTSKMSEAPQLSMQPREMTPYEYLIALVQPRREATSMIPRNITLPSSIINDISSPHLAGVSNTTPPVTSRTVPQISESWPTPGFDFSSLSSDSESSFSQDVDASSCVMLESSFENLPENPWCPLPSAGENGDAPYRRTRSMYGGFHTGTGVCAIGGGGYEAVQQGQALLNTYGSYHNLRFDPNIQSTQYATQVRERRFRESIVQV